MEELHKDAAWRNLQNLKTEKNNYLSKKENLQEFIKFTKREIDIRNKTIPHVLKALTPLNPSFAFESDKGFLSCKKEQEQLSHDRKVFELNQSISNWERELIFIDEELARINKEIPRAQKRYDEAKGEQYE